MFNSSLSLGLPCCAYQRLRPHWSCVHPRLTSSLPDVAGAMGPLRGQTQPPTSSAGDLASLPAPLPDVRPPARPVVLLCHVLSPQNMRRAVCRVVSMRPAQRPAASVLACMASTVRRLPTLNCVDRPSAPAVAAIRTHRFSVSRIGGLAILDSTHKGRLQAALSGRSECVKASSRLVLVGQGVIDEILLGEVRGRKPRHLRRC